MMEGGSGVRPLAIVLGGTIPHIELIKKLQLRGYRVALVDYLDNPPAKQYADEHIKESTLDLDSVLEVAKKNGAQLVISAAIDQANITCCYVAERLGLPHPYSYETALDVTHKDRMKRIMVSEGVPTAPFVSADSLDSIEAAGIDYPCVVKPTNSNGSRGVRVASCHSELLRFVEQAREASRTNDAIVESYVRGKEISSYYYVQEGVAFPLATCEKSNYTSKDSGEVCQYESVDYPACISEAAQCNLNDAAQKIVNAFHLSNTPLFIQAIISLDDSVSVLEFAPRLGGGLCFRSIPLLVGFDYVGAAIASFLGDTVEIPDIANRDVRYLSIGNLFAKEGIFDHVEWLNDAAEKMPDEIFYLKAPGAAVSGDGSSGSRYCQYICTGTSREEAHEKCRLVRNSVSAIDVSGKAMDIGGV